MLWNSGMDREQLRQWLDEGLSLPQIGRLTGELPGTVGYWVRKYGFVANGRAEFSRKGGLSKEKLEPLVDGGATLKEIAEQLDVGVDTVRRWLSRHGLRTLRSDGARTDLALEARSKGSNRFVSICRIHGETEFLVLPDGRSRCAKCNAAGVTHRRRRVKQILIEEAGGCCMICGYDRHPGALQFHHLEPNQKSFGIGSRGVTRAIEKARAEARKCVLLCANCHAEVEAGVTDVPLQFHLGT